MHSLWCCITKLKYCGKPIAMATAFLLGSGRYFVRIEHISSWVRYFIRKMIINLVLHCIIFWHKHDYLETINSKISVQVNNTISHNKNSFFLQICKMTGWPTSICSWIFREISINLSWVITKNNSDHRGNGKQSKQHPKTLTCSPNIYIVASASSSLSTALTKLSVQATGIWFTSTVLTSSLITGSLFTTSPVH